MAGYIGTQAVSVNTTSATISDDLTVGDDATITGDLAIGGATTIATDKKLIFRDSAIHISSTADGDMSIAADDEIDLTSTLIDINGAATFSQTRTETNTEADIGAYVNLRNLSTAINTGIGLTLGSNNNGGSAIIGQRVGANNEHILKIQTRNSSGASATRVTVESGGDLTIENGNLVIGTGAKGIDFSAQNPAQTTGASQTAELLDHYEEGTWTPIFHGGVSSITGYQIQVGKYTRVGRMVQAEFYLRGTAVGNGDQLQLGGLPFPISNNAYSRGWGGAGFESMIGTNSPQFYGQGNVTYFSMYHLGDLSYAIADDVTRTAQYVIGMFSYETDS